MNTSMYRLQIDLLLDALQTELGFSLGEAVESLFSGSLDVIWEVDTAAELGEAYAKATGLSDGNAEELGLELLNNRAWKLIPRLHCAVQL